MFMAYGGLQGQAPQGVAPINGLPTNDVRELTVRSGNNISAGDVVDVEGEEVFKNVKSSSIPEVVVNTDNHFISRVAKIGNYYVFATSRNSSIGYEIYSYNQNGTQISVMGENDVGEYGATLQIGYCGNKVVVFYYNSIQRNWIGQLYEISGSGELVKKDASTNIYEIKASLPLNDNQFIGFYTSGQLYAQIVDLSGTSPSYVKSTAIAEKNFADVISATQISDENGRKRFCVCYIDINDFNKAKAFILTLDSENNITTTSPITIENQGIDIKCVFLDGIVYINIDGGLYAFNEALTRLNQINIFSVSSESSNGLIALKNYVLAFNGTFNGTGDTSYGTAIALKYENQAFMQSEKYRLNKEDETRYFNGACISGNKAFVVYQSRASNISNDKATIEFFEVSNYQIANEFIDTSKTAIALQSASSGQPISVGFGGYCPCDGVIEGQSINSTGVMAYAPIDGWLDIRPEYEKSCEFGSYIGNGKYGVDNPNTLTFSFAPSMVHLLFRTAPEAGTNAGKDENLTGEGYGNEQKFMVASRLTTDYRQSEGFGYSSASTYGKKSADGKTFYWYAADMTNQCNATGTEYYYIAFR